MSSLMNELEIFERLVVTDAIKQSVRYYHVFGNDVLYVTDDDRVFGCGLNSGGRLGFGHNRCVDGPQEVRELRDKGVNQFFIGLDFVLAMTTDYRLYSWGCNEHGQLGRGSVLGIRWQYFKPDVIEYFSQSKARISQVMCCGFTAMALLENGKVFVWGLNTKSNLGLNEFITVDHDHFEKLYMLCLNLDVKSCMINQTFDIYNRFVNHFYAITGSGEVYSWQTKSVQFIFSKPKLIQELQGKNVQVIKMWGSKRFTYFLTEHGDIFYSDKSGKINEKPLQFYDKFIQLDKFNSFIVAMSDKHLVYELHANIAFETGFTSFEEYSVKEHKQTYKTFSVNKK